MLLDALAGQDHNATRNFLLLTPENEGIVIKEDAIVVIPEFPEDLHDKEITFSRKYVNPL
jgi:hypothetical protein